MDERKDCIACDSDAVRRDMTKRLNAAGAHAQSILYGHSTKRIQLHVIQITVS
jgi:hypothetical protein